MYSGLNRKKGARWETPTEAREENSFPSHKNSRSCQMGGGSPFGDHLFTLEGLKPGSSPGGGGPGGGCVPDRQADVEFTLLITTDDRTCIWQALVWDLTHTDSLHPHSHL